MDWALNLHIVSDPKLCIHYSQEFDELFMKKHPDINYAFCGMTDLLSVTKLMFFLCLNS